VDILRRILVAVVVLAALWTIPLTKIERETGQNVAAATAPLRGWEEAIHKPQLPSVSLALVFEHGSELAEAGIGDYLRQGTAFYHSPDVEVFDADSVVSTHQIGGHFVQVILSGVADVFLDAGNADALPVPSAASFCATGEDPLGLGKTSLVLARMLWVPYALPIGKGGETVNSKINPNRFPGWFELGKFFIQDQRDEISSAGSLGDCDCGRVGRELSTPVHIQPPKPADNQVRVVGVWSGKLECGSGVFGGLFVPLPLETRVRRILVEELHESVVQVSQGLLDGNARHFAEPSRFLLALPFGEFGGGLVVSNPFLPLLPSVSPIPERPVKDKPAATKYLSKLRLLGRSWCPTELVSNLHTNNLYV
jgi:hypothetical protein